MPQKQQKMASNQKNARKQTCFKIQFYIGIQPSQNFFLYFIERLPPLVPPLLPFIQYRLIKMKDNSEDYFFCQHIFTEIKFHKWRFTYMRYVSFVLHLNVHCSVFFLHSWFTVYIALVRRYRVYIYGHGIISVQRIFSVTPHLAM